MNPLPGGGGRGTAARGGGGGGGGPVNYYVDISIQIWAACHVKSWGAQWGGGGAWIKALRPPIKPPPLLILPPPHRGKTALMTGLRMGQSFIYIHPLTYYVHWTMIMTPRLYGYKQGLVRSIPYGKNT